MYDSVDRMTLKPRTSHSLEEGLPIKMARLQIYFSVKKGSWVSPRIILKEDSHIGHVLIEKCGL